MTIKSNYKYKLVVNGESIEMFNYSKSDDKYFAGDKEEVEKRKSIGKERIETLIKREDIDYETGEINRFEVDNYASLDEKLEKKFITSDEYRIKKLKSVTNSSNRRKTTVRRLIEANLKAWSDRPKFLTLTYAENFQDREQAIKDFDLFVRRICYQYADKVGENPKRKWLKYVSVIEYQKRGAIHFHTVIFNLPFIQAKEIADCWSKGAIHIQIVEKESIEDYRKMVGYMTKYISKTFYDEDEEGQITLGKHQNGYLRSRGLKKSQEIFFQKGEEDKLQKYLEGFEVGYENQFSNEYTGNVEYKHFYRQD